MSIRTFVAEGGLYCTHMDPPSTKLKPHTRDVHVWFSPGLDTMAWSLHEASSEPGARDLDGGMSVLEMRTLTENHSFFGLAQQLVV